MRILMFLLVLSWPFAEVRAQPIFIIYDQCILCEKGGGTYDPSTGDNALLSIPALGIFITCNESYNGGKLGFLSPEFCTGVQDIAATGKCGCDQVSPITTEPPSAACPPDGEGFEFFNDDNCPADGFGSLDQACNETDGLTCNYGREDCCDECHSAMLMFCDGSFGWIGLNTDACFSPFCDSVPFEPVIKESPCDFQGANDPLCPSSWITGEPCTAAQDGLSCQYGREDCCDECYAETKMFCDSSVDGWWWVGFSTDACFQPEC